MTYNGRSNDTKHEAYIDMIGARRVAKVLGIKRPVHSLQQLAAMVQAGLPKESLRHVVEHVAANPQERRVAMFAIIPEATYKRRKHRLKHDESERTERLARVIATAEYVWNDPADAREFLMTPHSGLGQQRPLDVAVTELGARAVEELLWKLFYGVTA